jgi:hypothetical protein
MFFFKLLFRLAVLGLAGFGAFKLYEEWAASPRLSTPPAPGPSFRYDVHDDLHAAETLAPGADVGADTALP